jgi:hypothetical protein
VELCIPQEDASRCELAIDYNDLAGLQSAQSFTLIGVLLAAQRRNARLQTAGTKTNHDDTSDETTEGCTRLDGCRRGSSDEQDHAQNVDR